MRKFMFLVAASLFLGALGFFLVGKQDAFAVHQCCTPQTCQLSDLGSSRTGNDFEVDYAYEWCHPATPLVAWIEMDTSFSENIATVSYDPDTFFPTHCHGAFQPTATGETSTGADATLVSVGKSWNATPVCSNSEATNL